MVVLFLLWRTGGLLQATGYCLPRYRRLLSAMTRSRTEMPTGITDSSILPLSWFSPFHLSVEKGWRMGWWGRRAPLLFCLQLPQVTGSIFTPSYKVSDSHTASHTFSYTGDPTAMFLIPSVCGCSAVKEKGSGFIQLYHVKHESFRLLQNSIKYKK